MAQMQDGVDAENAGRPPASSLARPPEPSVDHLVRSATDPFPTGIEVASNPGSASELLPLVYQQLRKLAQLRMSQENDNHTLQATALVHEVYVRLAGGDETSGKFANVAHFYAAAAEAMRRVLIDYAKARGTQKRGGDRRRVNLSTVLDLAAAPESEDILALDEALTRLEVEAPDAAAVVRMRFYAGLSVAETAKALGIATRTVDRDWAYARAWLYQQLRVTDDEGRNGS